MCFISADRHLPRPASLPTLHSAGTGGVADEDSYSETLRPEERLQYKKSLTSPLRRRAVSRLTIIPRGGKVLAKEEIVAFSHPKN